ncbi:MAG: AraC family transcriptional regulator [Actinobacteria bacterium HGW-Actinobacteria-2]|nr:MAG: AraC family transcriptional regulator [Actinobacteria bacterium HGW-Actinobacteria-2]
MELANLTEQIDRMVPACRGRQQQIVRARDGLVLLRQDRPSPLERSLYEPVVCLILQGSKDVFVGSRRLSVGPGECLLVSHDLPVRSQVTVAPYLALVFEIDVDTIRRLGERVAVPPREAAPGQAADVQVADPGLVAALSRYLNLGESGGGQDVLGPLTAEEIHYRLLTAPFGAMLRTLSLPDSSVSAVAQAISYLRANLRVPVVVPDLARHVGMSPSSFHKHFKAVTATTPLQYQKELRLLEARHLLAGGRSVTAAAFDVGYASSSQFSREYARKFGVPPSRDVSSRVG